MSPIAAGHGAGAPGRTAATSGTLPTIRSVAADPALNPPERIGPNAAGVPRIVVRLLPLVERLVAEVRRP
ncbi:MAG: hypothetical protein JO047_10390 [Alphaproteobacteria bacterium]|nr:hypothetical protein [Alphaproteobacteria bacterium]